jgi:hypothetical protein
MRLTDISDASRLATKHTSLKERRDAWAKLEAISSAVSRRINANGSSPDRLPMLDDDAQMSDALVEAIVGEYNKRITATENELKELGVTL